MCCPQLTRNDALLYRRLYPEAPALPKAQIHIYIRRALLQCPIYINLLYSYVLIRRANACVTLSLVSRRLFLTLCAQTVTRSFFSPHLTLPWHS